MIEEITDAVGQAVYGEFGDKCRIYDEEVKQGVKPPCFFIRCDKPSERHFLGDRYFRENRFCISYIPENDNGKRRECEETAERLFECLKWIRAKEDIIMGRNMSYEVKDGELRFFVSYDFFVYKVGENKTLMGKIEKFGGKVG